MRQILQLCAIHDNGVRWNFATFPIARRLASIKSVFCGGSFADSSKLISPYPGTKTKHHMLLNLHFHMRFNNKVIVKCSIQENAVLFNTTLRHYTAQMSDILLNSISIHEGNWSRMSISCILSILIVLLSADWIMLVDVYRSVQVLCFFAM